MDKIAHSFLMRHASLRQLQVLEAVGRHLSFTRAAEELHLAQPTVSAQIHNLTAAVGAPLFEQIGKRVYLTEMGRVLHAAACKVFDALLYAEMELDELKGLKRGLLRLAVVTTAKYFAPRVLGAFCERYPGLDVALKVTNRERLLERLVDNLDDIYIIGHPPEAPEFTFEHFLINPLVAIAAKQHPLAQQRRIPLAEFAREPFLAR
ncbi:MAG: LysR family transcriptional regulator, partial [Halothiobacillaceae bacterium]